MRMTFLLPVALIALIALGLATSNASATQIGVAPPNRSELAMKVADRDCMRDEKGWHYMEKERRHACKPKRPQGKDWGWKCEGPRCGWWHAKEKRWND